MHATRNNNNNNSSSSNNNNQAIDQPGKQRFFFFFVFMPRNAQEVAVWKWTQERSKKWGKEKEAIDGRSQHRHIKNKEKKQAQNEPALHSWEDKWRQQARSQPGRK